MTVERAQLLGSDWHSLGVVATAELGGRAGLALSRGRFPKSDLPVDLNEDAVLAVQDDERWLVAAADGHFGFDAARAAIGAVADASGDALSDPRDGRTVVTEVVEHAREGVAQALAGVDRRRAASRTTLSVALVRPGEAFACTCGDSSIFRVRGTQVVALTPTSRFLGPRTPPPPVVRAALEPTDVLSLVTDGFTDFLGATAAGTLGREILRNPGAAPVRTAHALVQAAFASGAGDNVGVVVLQASAGQAGRRP